MIDIDWSKAPEGTTHCDLSYDQRDERCWEKRDGDTWSYWQFGSWVYLSEDGDKRLADSRVRLIARPADPAWTGEGPPPVGTVCRLKSLESPFGEGDWGTAEILYSSKQAIVWRWQGHTVFEFGANFGDVKCEPIPTAEQIAAEEKEKVIAEMLAACPYPGSPVSRADCEHLYKAGYRKTEGGEA